jgi:hypothetical protein
MLRKLCELCEHIINLFMVLRTRQNNDKKTFDAKESRGNLLPCPKPRGADFDILGIFQYGQKPQFDW